MCPLMINMSSLTENQTWTCNLKLYRVLNLNLLKPQKNVLFCANFYILSIRRLHLKRALPVSLGTNLTLELTIGCITPRMTLMSLSYQWTDSLLT